MSSNKIEILVIKKEQRKKMQEDVSIRFEIVKVLGNQKQITNGVNDLLFDAQILYNFIKEGKIPNPETVSDAH
jgi:hypothetical protein